MVSGVFCFVRKDSAIVRLIALMFRKYRYRIDRASPEGRRSRIEPGVFGSSPGRSNSSARSRNRSFPTRCDRKSLRPDRNRQKPLRLGPPPRSRLAEGCIRKTGACGVSRGGTRRSREGNVRSRARTIFETRAQQLAFVEPDRPHRRVFQQGHAQVATLEPTIGELAVAQVGA